MSCSGMFFHESDLETVRALQIIRTYTWGVVPIKCDFVSLEGRNVEQNSYHSKR